jgi:eukaryotic-like serine/threonine-protein kinase
MAISTGTKFGPYEILAFLGAGGMGEVYRGRDTRLDRPVAVKILPTHLSDQPEARERFDREARAISSLNHPNICHLYDVGSQDGTNYLVMEYLEGETLADRLLRGPLPVDQVLKSSVEICEGLDRAHRGGVIHRDLKPGNIMLTRSGAKLMDFGLAKEALAPSSAASALTAVVSDKPLTAQGTIVGTFQYMAPEQLQGRPADARSDLFALGAVLYEMATGKRAFAGKTQLSVASAILEKDPEPMTASKPASPAGLERVVKGCLAKDPDERWQTAHDVKLQLRSLLEASSQPAAEAVALRPSRRTWQYAGWLLAGILFLLLLAAGVRLWNRAPNEVRPLFFQTSVPFSATDLAVSPDGRSIAMVAYSPQSSSNEIWMYEVGSQQPSLIPGTQGASYPFWSPDERYLGFFADGKLKKVDVGGNQVQVLCDAPNGRGGTWGRDGDILFTPDAIGRMGLHRVSSQGGSPVVQTKPDTAHDETSHRWPEFLPDGRHFLYMGANFTGRSADVNTIYLGSLDSQEKRPIVKTNANAVFVEPGFLVYMRGNTLVAQPFDLSRFALTGEPRVLTKDVLYFPQIARAVYTVSRDVLVTQTGTAPSVSQLTWFDRSGKPVGSIGSQGTYHNVRLSPDGHKVATDQTDPDGLNIDVWIHDPERGLTTRMTFDPALDYDPIWSPDGKQIMFGSSRQSGWRLYLKNSDGSGSEQKVVEIESGLWQVIPFDWSHDGKNVVFRNAAELWHLSLPERIARPIFQNKWTARNAQFSPDGRWLAYDSNETGGWEVYVSPFPSMNGKWQISPTGGQEPRWRGDGKEFFYLSPDGKMMAVPVSSAPSFEAGSPSELFLTHRRPPLGSTDVSSYDVTSDGKKFLINTKVDTGKAAPPSILLNWNWATGK